MMTRKGGLAPQGIKPRSAAPYAFKCFQMDQPSSVCFGISMLFIKAIVLPGYFHFLYECIFLLRLRGMRFRRILSKSVTGLQKFL